MAAVQTPSRSSLRNQILLAILSLVVFWGISLSVIFQNVLDGILLARGLDTATIGAISNRFILLSSGFTLGGIMVMLLLSLWFARRLSDPIRRLTEGAVRIAAGDLKAQVAVTGSDELGALGAAFNCMVEDLRRTTVSRDELEAAVIARTAELSRAHASLQEALGVAESARAKIDALVRSAADGLMVTDMDQRIVLLNPAAEDLLGVSLPAVEGRCSRAVFGESPFQERLGAVSAGEAQEGDLDLELAGEDPETPRIVRARISLIRDGAGGVTGVITSLRDVSRERELSRMKSEFIATAAHELRTPLTSVYGYTEMLLTTPELGVSEQREFLGIIFEKAEVLNRIIDDLLDLSRVESGRMIHLEKVPFDLGESLHLFIGQYRQEYPGRRFELELAPETRPVIADRGKVGQVLENLLSNAVKYSREGGTIRVSAAWGDDGCRVTVADDGIGMTSHQAARAFEKFYRANPSASAVGGLGLGLSIVRHIVDAHGGRVWLESQAQRGTRVSFLLPKETPRVDRERPLG
ncbi:sensor histidine kinase, PAS domain-containing [Desulfuromonas soudanensis]|uniref:histidine kinase n=1 Tax=Desulfuromonas soudanensis TaxID=1603606 RepID=A0A0M4CZ96_9BACT|nr:ATP-binding protein [Desulfuromonas soudanensis]ALC15802.1 sensor histidine kinase, PAS domain-containing [Desulfuromonas soudanensis]